MNKAGSMSCAASRQEKVRLVSQGSLTPSPSWYSAFQPAVLIIGEEVSIAGLKIGLAVPFMVNDVLLGFMLLGEKAPRQEYIPG